MPVVVAVGAAIGTEVIGGAIAGVVGSAVASAVGGAIGGALAGGVSSLAQGGDFEDGFKAGALGGVDPQLQKITQRQQLLGQLDQSDPESFMKVAQAAAQIGDNEFAMAIADAGRKAASEYALISQRTREKQGADPFEQLVRTGKYTPASLSKYQTSKNVADLELLEKTKDDVVVVGKVASFTGLSPDTIGKLGVAGVQSLLSSAGASKQAEQAREAAQTQADAQVRAAEIAADAAKFRPVGVTTRFGSSAFTTDAEGNVIGAGYAPSAEIKGYQDRLSTLAGQGMTDIEGARAAYQPLTGAAQSLFSLGQGYLAKSPEQAAQDYITKQQALITPSRQNQLAELQNRLFQQGRGGAATAQGGNLMATSPELAAYYNSLAQQDLVLAAEADQAAQQRIQFGSGLFDTGANLQGRYYTGQTAAYAPFATAMDTSAGLENLAQQPLEMGVNIGGRTTAGTAAGGRFLGEGIINAAATMAPANAYSASGNLLSGFAQNPMVSSALNNAFGVQPQQRTYTVDELKTIFGT